jgi:hypothetical protein
MGKNCNIKIRCVDIDYGLESYFRIGPSGCEHGNETSCSLKDGNFLLDERILAFQEGLYSMESVRI